MKRELDLSQPTGAPLHRYASVDDFLGEPARAGISEIMLGARPVHAFFDDRGFEATMVHFMAALPPKGWDKYPLFGGSALVKDVDVNRLSLSDPNYALEGKPATGWFAGAHDQPLQRHLAEVIRHFTRQGVEGQAILFGSSAGGFAALVYGAQIPESVTVAINPRVDLKQMPSQFPAYSKVSFPSSSLTAISARIHTSAAFAYLDSPGNTVAYIQNIQDDSYFEGNLLHFLGINHKNDNVYLSLVDSGPGHRMPRGTEVQDVLRALASGAPGFANALVELGYAKAPTVSYALAERSRQLGSDR